MLYAIVYMLLFLGAEMATDFFSLAVGLISYTTILTIIIVHSTVVIGKESPKSKLILALSLVPLVRMLSLFMPFTQFAPVYWYIIIYPPLFIAGWVARRRLNYKSSNVGLVVYNLPLQLLISLSGFVFGVLEYLVLRPSAPLVSNLTFNHVALAFISLGAGTGLVEEFIFRGIIQKASLDAMNEWGLYYTAFLFAILHLIHNSIMDVVLVFAIGLFFGWIVKKTGSLLGVILSHTITNYMLFVILPYFVNL